MSEWDVDVKTVRRALRAGALFVCPRCDEGTCLRCFEAQEAVERVMAHLWALHYQKGGLP